MAEAVAFLLCDEAVSANEYIKNKKTGVFDRSNRLVFVAPLYVYAPPMMFYDFIKRSEFNGEKKAWFIMTGAGKKSACDRFWRKLCNEKGFEYMGTEHIKMPQNYTVYFKIKSKEENEKTLKSALERVEMLSGKIKNGESFNNKPTGRFLYGITVVSINPYFKLFVDTKKFYSTEKCVSCGKCVEACVLNNVSLSNGKPVWGDKCTHCMGCINICPAKAIEYGKRTQKKSRYYCPPFEPTEK